jgi:hypothetical protein
MYRLAPGRAAALTRVVDAVGKMIIFFTTGSLKAFNSSIAAALHGDHFTIAKLVVKFTYAYVSHT